MWKIKQANQDDVIRAAKLTRFHPGNHAEVCIRQNFPACLPRSWIDQILGTEPACALIWTHQIFYQGLKGKAISWKPIQPSQPGSCKEALNFFIFRQSIQSVHRILKTWMQTAKQSAFFSKSVFWHAHMGFLPVGHVRRKSLTLFPLAPGLSFDCSPILDLQSIIMQKYGLFYSLTWVYSGFFNLNSTKSWRQFNRNKGAPLKNRVQHSNSDLIFKIYLTEASLCTCQPINQCVGGPTQKLLSKSRLFTSPDDHNTLMVAAGDESSSSVSDMDR